MATAEGFRPVADREARCAEGLTMIYALADPDTREIRYVGQTVVPGRRKWLHGSTSNNRGDRKVCAWVRDLLATGRKPLMVELETTREADSREVHWIAHMSETGARLLNMNGGGTSTHQFRRPKQWIALVTTKTPLRHALSVLAGAKAFCLKHGDLQQAEVMKARIEAVKAAVKRAEKREGRLQARERISSRLIIDHPGRFSRLLKPIQQTPDASP